MRNTFFVSFLLVAWSCVADSPAPHLAQNEASKTKTVNTEVIKTEALKNQIKESAEIHILRPVMPDRKLGNPWPQDWEDAFDKRAKQAVVLIAGKGYGGTYFENEKQSYAKAMMDFIAGNRKDLAGNPAQAAQLTLIRRRFTELKAAAS